MVGISWTKEFSADVKERREKRNTQTFVHQLNWILFSYFRAIFYWTWKVFHHNARARQQFHLHLIVAQTFSQFEIANSNTASYMYSLCIFLRYFAQNYTLMCAFAHALAICANWFHMFVANEKWASTELKSLTSKARYRSSLLPLSLFNTHAHTHSYTYIVDRSM